MIIKQSNKNGQSFGYVKSAVIAYPVSEAFKQAQFYAHKGLNEADMNKPFNTVIFVPETYADSLGEKVVSPEQVVTTVRNDVTGVPVAVLITDDGLAVGGVHYQFVYGSDKVEILTDSGVIVGGCGD